MLYNTFNKNVLKEGREGQKEGTKLSVPVRENNNINLR